MYDTISEAKSLDNARLRLAQAAGVLEPQVLADVNRVIRSGAQPKLKTGATINKPKKKKS